ncbi:hypothetical protein UlMin_045472 [Ulmus minor]
MEEKGAQLTRKRFKPDALEGDGAASASQIVEKAESETNNSGAGAGAGAGSGSEEMELIISHILERIDNFTHLVSELLESGKTMFKELSNEFEERMITIHKEQVEKWQQEIKELRLLDSTNEEANTLLHNARFLLQNPHIH